MRSFRQFLRKIRTYFFRGSYCLIAACCRQDRVVFLRNKYSDHYRNLDFVHDAMPDKSVCAWAVDGDFSMRGLYRLARAGVIVADQSSRSVSTLELVPQTQFVQVWHSSGLYKKVGFDALRRGYDRDAEIRRVSRIHGQIDWFVISDPSLCAAYAKAFRLPGGHVLPLGLPRTDALFQCDREAARRWFIGQHPEAKGKKLCLFAPTFRSDPSAEGGRAVAPLPDIAFLKEKLGAQWAFVFKPHPSVSQEPCPAGWLPASGMGYEKILAAADVLVTDYSSILFDFSCLRKPVFLYLPDIRKYKTAQRGLYVPPEKLVPPGCIAYDLESLAGMLAREVAPDQHIRERFMSACDGNSSARTANFIRKLMQRK